MNKSNKLVACLVVTLNGALFASSSFAATATTVVAVSATVVDSCTVSSAPMSFGNYNSNSGLDIVSTLSPVCTLGTAYAISLDAGVGAGATMPVRQLTGPGGAKLTYAVFADAPHSAIWGDGTGGTVQKMGTGSGGSQPFTMYGKIPPEQNATVGSYSDSITVTLTY